MTRTSETGAGDTGSTGSGPALGLSRGQALEAYRARESVLYHLREALERCDTWDAFREDLESRGLSEARVRQIVDVPVPMDLHLHSTCSDGQVPPAKLAWVARAIGLKTVALADHDSVAGTRALYGEAALLGINVIPAVELSTGRPGLEILVYFPDAGRFFAFLTSNRGSRFAKYLETKQAEVHEGTLKVLESVNRWLKRQGIGPEDSITLEELDAWFGGRKPYYPGTVAVLGLKRLDEERRRKLGIRDPRTFNTKVVTPALRRLGLAGSSRVSVADATADVKKQLVSLRKSPAGPVAILGHPKELVTKGKMSIGQVAKTIEYLTAKLGLDGVEVGCARDSEADVQVWREIIDEVDAKIEKGTLPAPGPLLVASFSSDFHALAPGRATGEITLGFGMLDERPAYQRGNLRPQTGPDELLEAMRRRAALRRKD